MPSFGERPAPETPVARSMMMSSGSITPALSSGRMRVDAGRRVAAGAGDQPRGADLVAVELGQAVDRLGLQVEREVRDGRTSARRRPGRAAGSRRRDRRSSGRAAARRSPPGSSRAAGRRRRGRSPPRSNASMVVSAGRSRWRRCGNTSPIVCPALRSAVSAAIRSPGMGRDQAHELGAGVAAGAEDGDVVDLAHACPSHRLRAARLRQTPAAINRSPSGMRSAGMSKVYEDLRHMEPIWNPYGMRHGAPQ